MNDRSLHSLTFSISVLGSGWLEVVIVILLLLVNARTTAMSASASASGGVWNG